MYKATLSEICNIIDVDIPSSLSSKTNLTVSRFVCKTFFVKPNSVFFCRGFTGNGEVATDEYSENEARIAYEKGAIAIVSNKQYFTANGIELPCIIVSNPLESYIKVCKEAKKQVKALTVAITGSVGKTTTKEMLNLVAKEKLNTFASGPTSNDFATISQIIQTLNEDVDVYLQEVGGFSPGFVERSSKILSPDVCVVTNIGVNHIDLYGSKENILKDKICVAKGISLNGGVAFLNYDDPLLSEVRLPCKAVWYSMENTKADFYAQNIEYEEDGISFDIRYNNNKAHLKIRTYGKHNVVNAVVAFAFGKYLKMEDCEIVSALQKYESQGVRQNLCNIGGYNLFIDCYNVSPDTVIESVKTLNKINNKNRKIVILGDVARMGEHSKVMHEKIGKEISNCGISTYILYGNFVKYTADILRQNGEKVFYTQNREQLNQYILQNSKVGDTILICGHHESHMDKSIDAVWGTSFYFNDSDMILLKSKNYEDDGYTFRKIDNLVEILNCKLEDEKIFLPSHFCEGKIKRIGANSFRKKLNLTSINIPEGIENIGEGAFYICTKLKDVNLPTTLKIIENNAFNYCKSIEFVETPDSLISIGKRAFYDCISLKNIIINKNVNFIGEDAFKNCKDITIHCYKSSYAYKYAVKNDIKYNLLDS